jgi:integrase
MLVASCARVDEIRNLRFRDCRFRTTDDVKGVLLVCTVTGKRGTRDIVADADAAEVIQDRHGNAGDLIFPHHSRDAFRELLVEAKLRTDNRGRVRNAKALRSTAICLALLKGKDIVFVSKNAGTSIEVISRYYSKYLTAEMAVRTSHPVELPVR